MYLLTKINYGGKQKLIRKKDSNELYNFFKNSKEIRNKIIEAKQHLPEASKLK